MVFKGALHVAPTLVQMYLGLYYENMVTFQAFLDLSWGIPMGRFLKIKIIVYNVVAIRGCNLPVSIKFPSSLLRKIWMLDTFQRGNILKSDFQFQFDLSPMFAEQLKHWNLDRW